ncbi:MAG TPA: hypothetical protein VKG78_02395, partial [Opitutaceae bacterium]|nr:hypothetical protein [Opitutaceae bacterium]
AGRGYALQMIHASFPSNFMPVDPKGIPLSDYQLGYALLAALAASLLLLFRVRARGAWAFAAASVVIPAFIVPVPWLTDALWRQVPAWFMNVENVWPMQRLFPIWSTVVAFLAAIVFASPQVAAAAWQRAVLAAGFICGAIWSGHEEWNIISMIPRVPPAQTRMELAPDNIQLTRYAYSSFAYAPGYFSHAYMEPWLENRLLDRHSLDPILENADAAAPLPPERAAGPADPRLARSGLLTAEDITGSNYYRLVPGLALSPGTHYALRLEFLDPGKPGTLQFMHPSMFREYMLPDSGSGIHRAAPFLPSLAFGSDASNSHVLPLTISGPGPATPEAFFIANKRTTETFPFARFWLYTYDRSRLPIDVKSWIPYRARVEPRGPAYLETPRMWVRGWRALVNGRRVPILRSRENLVMVPVEAGPNEVVLEYVAPPVLSATFWMCTSGWLALAGAGLCQLALWSGGGRLRFGWTHRWSGGCGILAPLGRNLARPLRFARGRWAWSGASATAVLAIAAVYAAVERNIGRRQAYLDAAGPVRIEFTRPYHNLGLTQPLLATGRPHTGAIVGIKFLDSRRVRLGADVWGTFYQSEPLDMDYNQVQSLVVSDSALYPPDHPRVKALRPSEARQLRGELRVELNGRTEIRAPCYAYETEPSEVLAGETRFGSIAEERYAGEILKVERLPIPRTKSLPSGHHAHLRVRFPEGAAGASEPVLSVVSGANTRLCYATYLGRGRLRMTCWGPGDVPVQSAEVAYDPERSHSLDLHPGEAAGAPHGFDVACYLDGARVLGRDPTPSSPPPVLVSGLNQAKAPGVLERFTGRQLDLTLEQDAPQPGATETMGTVHLVLNLPTVRIGRHEPLLTTGRTGAGDLVFVIYEDESHVRIGHDHWGAAAKTSAALALDYNLPHEIWISSGALYPTPGDDAFWRGLDTASRQRLKSAVSVVLDGQSVLSSATQAYPSAPTEVTIGKNRIGGSTCDADFSGEVEFSERTGPVPPPPQGR